MDFPSALLSFLAGATVRSLVLAVLPLALLATFRVKSAATRHAVLFVVTAGMLGLALLNPVLPPIPLAVLRADPTPADLPDVSAPLVSVEDAASASLPARPVALATPLWPSLLAAVYFAGLVFCLTRLLFGALFTRRLLRGARQIQSDFGPQVYESSWISVPLTAGWLRPRVLLPTGWQQWEQLKLDAALLHERNHIRRGDWAIALLAAVNRSLFWFNPLAWWLERRLSTLAEQACDDAALLALGQRESYAQTLLEMAAAVKSGQGRLVWDAMAMAKGTEVRMRIERILDDSRQIPRALTRSHWLTLVACSLPLIYFTAVLKPVPAEAQGQGQSPAAIADMLKARVQLTAGDAAQLEQYLVSNPGDVQARSRLILYYFSAGVSEPRLTHMYWLIANHPESNEAALTSQGITPRATAFNTTADYEHAAALWRQQAASHPSDEKVLMNAAAFLAQPGGDPNEAERILLQVRALRPDMRNAAGTDRLAKLYATAILGTAGDPKFPNLSPDFANRVRSQIESDTDGQVLYTTGSILVNAARRPQPGESLPPGVLNLDEHPALLAITDLGRRLEERASQFGGPRMPAASQLAALRQLPPPPPSPQQANPGLPVISPKPVAVSTVDPVYPPLARQARIQGVISLAVTITPDGHPANIQVLRGHPLLVQAALDAVRQWVYPAVSQAGTFEEQVTFTLPPNSTAEALPPNSPRKGSQGLSENKVFTFGQTGEPAPAVPQRIKVGGNVQAAMLAKKVAPVYPDQAKSAGIQGSVTLDVVIAKDGTVESVTPVEGHPLLVAAAVEAVQQWVYKTTLLNGQPIEVATTVTVPFELNQ